MLLKCIQNSCHLSQCLYLSLHSCFFLLCAHCARAFTLFVHFTSTSTCLYVSIIHSWSFNFRTFASIDSPFGQIALDCAVASQSSHARFFVGKARESRFVSRILWSLWFFSLICAMFSFLFMATIFHPSNICMYTIQNNNKKYIPSFFAAVVVIVFSAHSLFLVLQIMYFSNFNSKAYLYSHLFRLKLNDFDFSQSLL